MGSDTEKTAYDSKADFMKSDTAKMADDSEPPPAYEKVVGVPPLKIPPLAPQTPAGDPETSTVTPDQCAAHLKLLAALADLRDSVANHDGLFGLYDSSADGFEDKADEGRARIREKRWAVYTARAVDRYTAWFQNCVPTYGERPTTSTLQDKRYDQVTMCGATIGWFEDHMPPLDILMVWHSHMLNPRSFLEDCIRYARMGLWGSGFPWGAVNNCINNYTMKYTTGEPSRAIFEASTGLNWDNLHDSPDKTVDCPICGTRVSVPWTTGKIYSYVHKAFEHFHGYSDKKFAAPCPKCKATINHERLKVLKFRKDVQALLQHSFPMAGTFYNLRGIPEAGVQATMHRVTFPNRFLQAASRSSLGLNDTKMRVCDTMSSLRHRLESWLEDKEIRLEAQGHATPRPALLQEERIAFRRMMSRYWNNLSPFAIDLVGAVTRQGSFVRKMDDIDWVHSPTVMETMSRLIQKYEVFLDIMATHPYQMAVPTLPVDLAWHSHQLSPARYYHYTLRVTARRSGRGFFIDHDDKVDEKKLSDGFEWTSKMYRKFTDGGVYSECTCWYCEATRAPDMTTRLGIPSKSRARVRDAVDELHDSTSSDPTKNPHISAHNAVQAQHTPHRDPTRREIKNMLLQNNYQKARRRAGKRRSRHGEAADRERSPDDGAYPLVWGFPLYVPFYAPYMADPCIHSDAYACDPACMSFADGAAGNCAKGTCGAGVAAGACGAPGVGGCTGGPAGGSYSTGTGAGGVGYGGGGCGGAGGCASGGGGGCGGGGGGGGGGGC